MREGKRQALRCIPLLRQTYPSAHIVLSSSNPWELLVAVILSAQCTDTKVNEVTARLFRKYPTIADYLNASPRGFEQDIRATGFYRAKAKHILAAARIVHEQFGDRVPRTMAELLQLPGVARKTANVVLGNAYGVVEGIAVDTHVLRLSQRLRLVPVGEAGGTHRVLFEKNGKRVTDYAKDADPVKIEAILMHILPKSDWFHVTYLFIDHGRAVCKAQRPDCAHCMLQKFCPAARV